MRRTGKRASVPLTATEGISGAGTTKLVLLEVLDIYSILSEKMQCFLNGAIGEGKQHAVLGRLMPDFLPARDDEEVALLPIDDEVVADMCATATLDRRKHGRVC